MTKKKKVDLPIAMCDVTGCTRVAAYGFREIIDNEGFTTSGFIMGIVPNWCKVHDAVQRSMYANKSGRYIKF